jgi:transcriptional regulator with XRE-family HTH domain
MTSRKHRSRDRDKNIGAVLRHHRIARGLLQSKLGDMIDVCRQIQKYENGTDRLAASTAVDLAEQFGVTVDELLGRPRRCVGETCAQKQGAWKQSRAAAPKTLKLAWGRPQMGQGETMNRLLYVATATALTSLVMFDPTLAENPARAFGKSVHTLPLDDWATWLGGVW